MWGSLVVAMPQWSPRGVLYGCSESFQLFIMKVCPYVVLDFYMDLENQRRDIDFLEVFSGRAHLTSQLREVSWLIVGSFLFHSLLF